MVAYSYSLLVLVVEKYNKLGLSPSLHHEGDTLLTYSQLLCLCENRGVYICSSNKVNGVSSFLEVIKMLLSKLKGFFPLFFEVKVLLPRVCQNIVL